MEILKNLIKDEKKFFEQYVHISLLLNALLIPLSGIYELGLTLSIYGQIVGIIFLLTFFCNLGLIYLNERYLNKTIEKERRLHLLTYGYLLFAILTVITLMVSAYIGGIKRHTFDPMYYILWIYGFVIAYLDYTILVPKNRNEKEDPIRIRRNENTMKIILITLIFLTVIFSGFFTFNYISSGPSLSPVLFLIYIFLLLLIPILIIFFPVIGISLLKYKWKQSSIALTIKGLLKVALLSLSLLTFVLAGFVAVNLLTGSGPPFVIIILVINLFLPFFFPSLLLIIPILTILLYKLIPREWKKVSQSLTFIGFFLTISFALPYLAAPVSIIDANNQFTDVFGRDWNEFHPAVQEEFLDMQHVLLHSWFGEPELDPDSWKLDSNHVYKETDDYRLKFDVYYPGPTGASFIGEKATIIFFHGGGWSTGHRSPAKYLKYFASQGYVGFSVSYRLLEGVLDSPDKSYVGDYNIEDIMEDIANFTRYIAANEDEDFAHGADLDNVFLMGQSSGAHLAGVTGFGYNDDEWGLDNGLKIKGIVMFYPPNNARELFSEDSIFYEKGFTKYKTPEDDPDFFDSYTPSKLVDDDDPPCLTIHGTSDSWVPYEHSVEIKKACDKNDVDVILISNYFTGHAHDISYLFQSMSKYYIERFMYLIKED